MSQDNVSPADDPVMQPFVEFWGSYMQQANDTTKKMFENLNGTADPQVWRRRWLDAVSESLDAFMRTPAFLQTMKHNMDAIIKAKDHAEDVSQEFARNANIPTASDISGLFERLHSVEETIITRLGEIEGRLGEIENKLGNAEQKA